MSEIMRMIMKSTGSAELDGLKNLLYLTLAASGAGYSVQQYIRYHKNKVEKLAKSMLVGKKSIENLLGDDGITLAKDIQLNSKYDYEHVLIVGPTGAGKSTSLFIPNLLSNNIRGSVVVCDPKSEMFNLTSRYQQQVCGRKVYRFNPLSPSNSEHYNILENCKDSEEIRDLAENLLLNGSLSIELKSGRKNNDVEWVNMATPLLSAALLYAYHQPKPFNTIEFALQLILKSDISILDILFENSEFEDVRDNWSIFKTSLDSPKTASSIKITLTTNMKLFTSDLINKSIADTTFNFEKFRQEESILYITFPENKANKISPLISVFLTQMFDRLVDSYDKNDLSIHFMCDEFSNIGLIPNMQSLAATCRSRKISLMICLQSITQLYQLYGVDNGKSILNNLKTKVILGGLSDETTLNHISNIIGNKEITIKSQNVNEKSTSETYSKTKVKLFEPSDLRIMEDNELVIVSGNKNPIKVEKNTYYTQEKYTKNIGVPVDIKYKHSSINSKTTEKVNELNEEILKMILAEKKERAKKKYTAKHKKDATEQLNDMFDE